MKNQKIKLAGVLLGAALTSTGAFAASGSCGAGKCGSEPKKVETKGSCGAGKCGSEKKDQTSTNTNEMSGNAGKKTNMACGAGKCGANMNKKVEGSCGAGKCG
ncbi:hypothetical protein CRV08_07410 [Halarcobacter ebronensis]|uniref:Low-complexity protein n=1 Tax=Halarcobacter ebronensis TaxID=1462615 RepID=A0A4Q1B0H6_9BACT|nr:hypothetical protein [Halarcobacter ebronensis]QKF80709.1 hypothetical protein AEBR_0192 [Halarcobacter ebronensis]RXJ68641.1 hypothetical protein CRV08_07410 [Halarcobacter ebronensis]RXK08503.1 hypothetical protein CRV07_01505 [Halarcobacter ebronensis]